MNPTLLILAAVVAVLAISFFAARTWARHARGRSGDLGDLGVVSTRWISELRRDEPWSSS